MAVSWGRGFGIVCLIACLVLGLALICGMNPIMPQGCSRKCMEIDLFSNSSETNVKLVKESAACLNGDETPGGARTSSPKKPGHLELMKISGCMLKSQTTITPN